jgi:hypothetical protein
MEEIKLTLTLSLVKRDQYYLNGTRLAFDAPYEIFIVNGDRYVPYYRVHIAGQLAAIVNHEREAEQFLFNLTSAQAHIFSNHWEEEHA